MIAHPRSPRAARFQHVVFTEPRPARRIVNLAPNPRPLPPSRNATHAADDAFVRWLFRAAGLDAAVYRPETLRRRLPACLRVLRAASCAEAKQILMLEPSRLSGAVSAIVIGVSSFFRDASVFDDVTYTVLRDLRNRPRPARIWSAGCSSGEELYSVAILLAEMNLLSGATLLGTDCRTQAIVTARAARYSAAALQTVPPPWIEKYFIETGGSWQIVQSMRQQLQWRAGDATQLSEPGEWDVILCRNMAMYLRPQVSARLWEQMEQALSPGGYLVIGKAERPVGATRLSASRPCIFRRDRG